MDDMTPTGEPEVQFELEAPKRGVRVDVRLRRAGERWLAVSATSALVQTGLGRTARDALVASLTPLGAASTAELLLDLRLLDVSCELLVLAA